MSLVTVLKNVVHIVVHMHCYQILYMCILINMFSGRTQELEEQQPSVEQELRRLLDKPGEGFNGESDSTTEKVN